MIQMLHITLLVVGPCTYNIIHTMQHTHLRMLLQIKGLPITVSKVTDAAHSRHRTVCSKQCRQHSCNMHLIYMHTISIIVFQLYTNTVVQMFLVICVSEQTTQNNTHYKHHTESSWCSRWRHQCTWRTWYGVQHSLAVLLFVPACSACEEEHSVLTLLLSLQTSLDQIQQFWCPACTK